jgi:hypothetical protein
MSTDVTTVKEQLPVAYEGMMEDAGIGRENMGMEDIALPYITILQSLSPQVKKSSPSKIEGAEEGDLFNTVTKELFSGEEGLKVIPCAFQKAWVEWKDREEGGGWVGTHDSEAILEKCKRNERGIDVLPNGNFIIPTYYYYVIVLRDVGIEPAIIALSRTQLKYGRKWNTAITTKMVMSPKGPFNPPMFAQMYQISTEPESNAKGEWYSFKIAPLGLIQDPELYNKCKEFAQQVAKGTVRVAPPPSDLDEEPEPATVRAKVGKSDDVPF